jgi:hypothetical protein
VPAEAAVGGLAAIGLGGTAEVPRTRSYDDGGSTQVLPSAAAPSGPSPEAPEAEPDGEDARRGPVLLVVGAALAVVIAMVIAFTIGLHDRDDRDGSQAGTDPSTSPSSTSEATPSESAPPPTAKAMTDFVTTYIETAVDDPTAAFAMLTPEFQQASNGFAGYNGFWGSVVSAQVQQISGDPEALEVRYRYRYVRPPGPPVTQVVTLRLVPDGDSFLIAGEA